MDGTYFKEKRVLVTGASKGIGRAICTELSKYGAKLIAVGRNATDLESLKVTVPSIETVVLDIAEDWQKTKSVLSTKAPFDLLVNNAGEGLIKPFTDVQERDIDRIFGLNVKAMMNVSQIVVDDLLRRKSPGVIVNISSQAALIGLMNHTTYCSSKGAVDAFTRALALELGPHNIRVNSINPTVVMTDMGRKWWSDPNRAAPMLSRIPLKRFCEVQEVVDAVVFLLSDKSSMITGTSLPIDGGVTAS